MAKIIVIAGSAASGHTTICEAVRAKLGLPRGISATTRPPKQRDMANAGKYHFVSARLFKQMRRRGELLESAKNHGEWYGTEAKSVMTLINNGQDVLLEIDVKGALDLKKRFPGQVVIIFILPENFRQLERRMRERGDDPGEIAARLKTAKGELQHWYEFDELVINRQGEVGLDSAVTKACELIVWHRDHT